MELKADDNKEVDLAEEVELRTLLCHRKLDLVLLTMETRPRPEANILCEAWAHQSRG